VKSVKEKDVVASLVKLRDLLQADVGVAAQVLKALVGDVVIEKRQIEGQEKPQMLARFSINAVPALAVLDRGHAADGDESQASMWGSLHADRKNTSTRPLDQEEVLVPLPRKMPRQQSTTIRPQASAD
jgi:hypothetical protein